MIDDLAPEKRVALAYTPAEKRGPLASYLALDQRLAQMIAQASEPLLAQIRLAWWRDELAKPVELRPAGDPVLDALGAHWIGEEAALSALIDAWELLLSESPLHDHVAREFVIGRSAPWSSLARLAGVPSTDLADQAGRLWSAMDAAVHSSAEQEQDIFRALAQAICLPRLPRSLRGLAVLAGLAKRALERNEAALMAGRGGALAALRLGIFGR